MARSASAIAAEKAPTAASAPRTSATVRGNVSDPLTLWAEGANWSVTGTATDKAGNNASATVSGINIDLTRPLSTASIVSGTAGNNGWYTSDVKLSLRASDNLSGVKTTFYKVDDGVQQTYAGVPLNITGDLVHTITFWSMDKAGNIENVESGKEGGK